MLVRDVMARTVRTVKPEDTIRTVAATICTQDITGLPVVDDDNNLIGLISEKDVLHSLLPDYKEYLDDPIGARDFEAMEASYPAVLNKQVKDLMTPKPFSVTSDCPVLMAATRMTLHRFRRIPVVDGGKLVGIVTLGDIHKAIFKVTLGL
ncbi:MAG: CBS domain-containing protein [Magnetococcales bacterium]|nr:CBS domain-containing protein [Magnetococcales bacterium]NGZ27776.1 CBS domain-containing protein [Magnetococcales bacterium]